MPGARLPGIAVGLGCNMGAVISGIGFWGPSYCKYNLIRNPQNSVGTYLGPYKVTYLIYGSFLAVTLRIPNLVHGCLLDLPDYRQFHMLTVNRTRRLGFVGEGGYDRGCSRF